MDIRNNKLRNVLIQAGMNFSQSETSLLLRGGGGGGGEGRGRGRGGGGEGEGRGGEGGRVNRKDPSKISREWSLTAFTDAIQRNRMSLFALNSQSHWLLFANFGKLGRFFLKFDHVRKKLFREIIYHKNSPEFLESFDIFWLMKYFDFK